MPESRVRKSADEKKKPKKAGSEAKPTKTGPEAKPKKTPDLAAKPKQKRVKAPTSRRWVPPTFITVGLLGVAWLIVYYIAGRDVPFMAALGNWNILIGMGGMAASFGIATLWK